MDINCKNCLLNIQINNHPFCAKKGKPIKNEENKVCKHFAEKDRRVYLTNTESSDSEC